MNCSGSLEDTIHFTKLYTGSGYIQKIIHKAVCTSSTLSSYEKLQTYTGTETLPASFTTWKNKVFMEIFATYGVGLHNLYLTMGILPSKF